MLTDNSSTDSLELCLPSTPEVPDVAFVACIECGALESQALLLFESIRLYTGRFRNSAVYALSPRKGYGISRSARTKLDALGVTYSDSNLNTECPDYGSANRVVAAAHIENTTRHDILVILDSDTLFLREPAEINLPSDSDIAVRPVDVKGISTSGADDANEGYWRELTRCCGVVYDDIPWTESFVDQQRIKANYNGGLIIVRANLGILDRWSEFFFRSMRQQLYPRPTGRGFRAGAGWVTPAVSRMWGSNQAALSLAIWSTTRRVRELPATYNYPLHSHSKLDRIRRRAAFPNLVHVHYHWLFDSDSLRANPLWRRFGPLSKPQRQWLAASTPIA